MLGCSVLGNSGPDGAISLGNGTTGTLDLEAGAARLVAMSRDPATAFDRLSAAPDDPGRILRGIGGERQHQLRMIFRRAVQYAAANGDGGCTAWYDPFTGAWLIAQWQKGTNLWAMRHFGVALSEQMEPSAAAPSAMTVALAKRFGRQAGNATALFRGAVYARGTCAVPGDEAASAAALDTALHRSLDLETGLETLARTPGYAKYAAALPTADTALPLPKVIRHTLHAVASADIGAGRRAVLMLSPLAPSKVVVARMKASADGGALIDARLDDFFAGVSR